MWANANTQWTDQNYIGAGIPFLRDYVCKCIADAGGTSNGLVPGQTGAGQTWGGTSVTGCSRYWNVHLC